MEPYQVVHSATGTVVFESHEHGDCTLDIATRQKWGGEFELLHTNTGEVELFGAPLPGEYDTRTPEEKEEEERELPEEVKAALPVKPPIPESLLAARAKSSDLSASKVKVFKMVDGHIDIGVEKEP